MDPCDENLQPAEATPDREVLDILLESDLYLELPLKERQQLFRHIVREYLYPASGNQGTC